MSAAALPPVAAALEGIIGRRLTMALASSTDAGTVYVPLRPKPTHKLVQVIGMAATVKLAETFGGQTVRIPVCDQVRRASRDAEIRKLAADGVTQVEIARRFGMTDRAVRYILAQQPR